MAQPDDGPPKIGPTVETMNPMEIQPMGPAPDWAPSIDPQMLAVVEQLGAFEQPPFPEMTGFQARNAKTPAEAVVALLMKTGHGPMPPKTDIGHRVLPVGSDDGTLVRTYTPLEGDGPFPVIVYYHGGGWVIADLDTYEPSAAALAAKTGAVVVSVAYRQAPEHTYPTAHDDAFAAYEWVVNNAAELNGDASRIAVAGESAGGNLAVATAMRARDEVVALPVHILSVYPIADGDVQSPSYDAYAKAVPLNRPAMEWFFDYYTPNWRTEDYPWVNLIDADLSSLPPTTIINAEIDPLAAEGETLAERLEAAGVEAERRLYPGVTHEFFGMAALLEQAVEAQGYAASRLKSAFGM
jgi:acetyl esterase/lipase